MNTNELISLKTEIMGDMDEYAQALDYSLWFTLFPYESNSHAVVEKPEIKKTKKGQKQEVVKKTKRSGRWEKEIILLKDIDVSNKIVELDHDHYSRLVKAEPRIEIVEMIIASNPIVVRRGKKKFTILSRFAIYRLAEKNELTELPAIVVYDDGEFDAVWPLVSELIAERGGSEEKAYFDAIRKNWSSLFKSPFSVSLSGGLLGVCGKTIKTWMKLNERT